MGNHPRLTLQFKNHIIIISYLSPTLPLSGAQISKLFMSCLNPERSIVLYWSVLSVNLKPKLAIFAFTHFLFTIFLVFQSHTLDPDGCHGPLFVSKFILFLPLSCIGLIPFTRDIGCVSTGYGYHSEHWNGGNLVAEDRKQNHYMILGESRTFNYFLVRVLRFI